MTQVDRNVLIRIFECISVIMADNRDLLCELDADMGDGDLGLTMAKAFPAAEKEARENPETDIGKLMMRCGMKMNSAAPSTMGTLMSSGFVFAGKANAGKTALNAEAFTEFYLQFADGVANRGKAKTGERTVLDTLYPAAEAARQAFTDNADIAGIAAAALAGSQSGLEATKEMLPVYGKAAVFIAKAKGKIDQGALVGKLFAQGISEAVC